MTVSLAARLALRPERREEVDHGPRPPPTPHQHMVGRAEPRWPCCEHGHNDKCYSLRAGYTRTTSQWLAEPATKAPAGSQWSAPHNMDCNPTRWP